MNPASGFLIPRERGITHNGDIRIPATPEKPIPLRPNNTHLEMASNQGPGENWPDLLGLYTGVLNDSGSVLPQKFSPNSQGAAYCKRIRQYSNSMGIEGPKIRLQSGALGEACSWQPQNFNPNGLKGVNGVEHIPQQVEVRNVQKFGTLDPSTFVQDLGEVVPEEINSTEVPISSVLPNRSTYDSRESTVVCPYSGVESIQMSCAPFGAEVQQSYLADRDVGGYNLQEMSNGRHSVPYGHHYNLNLPPGPESEEPSSAARPLLLGPVTPTPKKQLKNCEIIQVPSSLTIGTFSKELHKKDSAVLTQQNESLEREHTQSLVNSLDKPTEATLTSPAEKSNSDGGIGTIDLNKTPPQKTPKRRKHRPKVVVEGKPKRTPKPAPTENNTPNGKPKRKYVRKTDNQKFTSPSTEVRNIVEMAGPGPAKKSCKRTLNFDLDSGVEKESCSRVFDCQAQNNGRSNLPLNLDSNNAEWPRLNGLSTSAMKERHQISCSKEIQQTRTINSFIRPNNVVHQDSMPWGTTALAPPMSKCDTLNLVAQLVSQATSSERISGNIAQLVCQATSSDPNLHNRRQSMLPTLSWLHNMVADNEKQGSNKEHIDTELRQLKTTTFMSSRLCSYGVSREGQCNNESDRLLQNTLVKGKMKIEDKFRGTLSSLPSGINTLDDSLGKMESIRNKNFPVRGTARRQNGGITYLDGKVQSMSRNSYDKLNSSDRCIPYQDLMREFEQVHGLSQLQNNAERTTQKTSNYANEQSNNSLRSSINWNPAESASQRNCKPVPTNEIIIHPGPVTVKRPVGRPKKVHRSDEFHQQNPRNSRSYELSSKKARGLEKEQKVSVSIDDITSCMKELYINDNGKEITWNERNALVPYKGDGAIVPYKEFDLVKKKRPRPRVDLDPETNRLWNLLMGKEGSDMADTMDADKQKWWEEERKVFRGRVDSFIARMHLVQGDRRFSKWKGSVVDSVVGVFLTQNVSDHLSSSAFMSLAAKFPLKSTTTVGQSSCENGASSTVERHEVRITFPDGTMCDHKIMKELSYNNGSTTSHQSSERRIENVTNKNRTFSINDHARRTEEDIILSSQSSSESLIFQASEDIRSSSGSNSEAEDGWNFGKNLGCLSVPEQPERVAALQQHQLHFMVGSVPTMRRLIGHRKLENLSYRQNLEQASSSNGYSYPFKSNVPPHQSSVPQSSNNSWTNLLMGPEWEADDLTFSRKESLSSCTSINLEVCNGKGIEPAHENIGLCTDIRFTAPQNRRQQFQMPPANHAIRNKLQELQTDFPADRSQSRNGQQFSNCGQGKNETFQQDSIFQTAPRRPAQASNRQPNDNSKDTGTTLVTTEKEQVHSSDKPSETANSTASNARKRKAEKEKAEQFDWDTLRKQVQSETGSRERSKETMDSLDYEALRTADVREISETIKERGMNNMLAERMKDFLNRLVRDHGRIDLEWLRDIPPDKAKDYLLSIRGLGLKSVECVRLLTLHHLAFPVDTNVGRIAVRLGWVPLQPLPESLQLHLLELYPVLETIQKYLWPRLCKLDLETLYELHYQMITFGKVFCTKREPNCNACPMRAECRHFASAFANARLALPAPGEKQIVSSAAPIAATKSSDVLVKPMPLPSSEGTSDREIGLTRNYEPFVEEPTTPEPPTEVLEKDIEDAFYEDPDEIPVIKLNVEEFTTNLQNIIQEKMEMGEGDMSKALVALTPELASIPVPKLKHVSRLRTEHQVYELPDSHPLLKGMDRREPDDPSPYLLAIWTPGETADSVQPPESKCSSQEGGGLCSKSSCFSCSSAREAQAQTVRGTILIPCRTAMKGSFPLNGTYFQVNEVFADHDSSLNPIDVPRCLIWNLPRRTVFFGTSVSTIFKGLSTEGIQYCFWKGFVCVRGFDKKTRAPRPLKARLHLPASKVAKQNE